MGRVTIEIGTADPDLLLMGIDPRPELFTRGESLQAGGAFETHEIGSEPMAIAAATAPSVV